MSDYLAGADTRTLSDYLDQLRSGSPTPGGGSAAAYAGALGAGLLAMVCRLTLIAPANEGNARLSAVAERLDGLVQRLSEAAQDDELCYGRYRAAAALPKATDAEKQVRREAMQAALVQAARSPLTSARLAIDALALAPEVAQVGTIHALSDVRTALELLPASTRGSLVNVRVNIDMITNVEMQGELVEACVDLKRALELAQSETISALDLRLREARNRT